MPQHISQLVSEDSRSLLERLRRPHCQRILKAHGVQFDPTAPKKKLEQLIISLDIDVTQPIEGESLFEPVAVKDEDGNTSVEYYPKQKEHATANQEIDYDKIIEEKAKAHDEEVEGLQARIDKLEQIILAMHEDKSAGKADEDEPGTEPVNSSTKMPELRAKAKELGINSFGMKKAQLIEAINGNAT